MFRKFYLTRSRIAFFAILIPATEKVSFVAAGSISDWIWLLLNLAEPVPLFKKVLYAGKKATKIARVRELPGQ